MAMVEINEAYLKAIKPRRPPSAQPSREPKVWPYVWRVMTRLPHRKGQLCRVLIRGGMNSCLIEFEDGARHVTSRNFFRRRKD